jgi:hypothetical protein
MSDPMRILTEYFYKRGHWLELLNMCDGLLGVIKGGEFIDKLSYPQFPEKDSPLLICFL